MKTLIYIVALSLLLMLIAGFVFAKGQEDKGPVVPAASGAPLTNLASIISAAQLKERIDTGDPNLVIFGVINPTAALIPLSASSRSIEGAYLVWRPDYTGGGSSEAIGPEVTGFRKSREEMEALLSRAGITYDSRIVVYSADNMHDATRFIWQLSLLGLDASYLDGGINAWVAAGYPTGRGVRLADQSPKNQFRARVYDTAKNNASLSLVVQALRNPNEWVVIDARSKDENDGKQSGNSAGAFGTGRIKGSVFITWTDALDTKTQLLKSRAELEAIYGNVIRGKKVIAYCQSGVRSAHTWLVLSEALGAKEVYNFDGSWIEWSFAASEASGNRFNEVLPITEEWKDNKKPI